MYFGGRDVSVARGRGKAMLTPLGLPSVSGRAAALGPGLGWVGWAPWVAWRAFLTAVDGRSRVPVWCLLVLGPAGTALGADGQHMCLCVMTAL